MRPKFLSSCLPSILRRVYPHRYPVLLSRPREMSTRSYKDALEHLNTLQTNAAVLDAIRASGGRSSDLAIPEMVEYLNRIGYSVNDLNALNVIHITGTKGKGSTSAFTDSILRHALPGKNVGLYTSPHLSVVRERIRINGAPISEELFTKYFFEVWDKLEANTKRQHESTSLMPGYFRFLTIMAFHTFLDLRVDATVLEVGVGGTYDSTNIVPKPAVTGITALGIDHVNILGNTLAQIAWQKGGIFKEGVPAITVEQPEEGLKVLEERAQELKASTFEIVPRIPDLEEIELGLSGSHQRQNARLAVKLVQSFIASTSPADLDEQPLPESFIAGLKNTRWPGRCQTVPDPVRQSVTWYLDGAHTVESLGCCAKWFLTPGVGLDITGIKRHRVLLFNCTRGRSGLSFLGVIHTALCNQLKALGLQQDPAAFFDHVIFCANVTYADGHFKPDLASSVVDPKDQVLADQHQLASAWSTLVPTFPSTNIHILPTIEHAVKTVEKVKEELGDLTVLVAGSLHLVGGTIEVAGLSDVALYG